MTKRRRCGGFLQTYVLMDVCMVADSTHVCLSPRPTLQHIGPDSGGMMFDDAIWAYWSSNLTSWPPNQKAVVLNRTNVKEPSFQTGRVGLPSVLAIPGNTKQLAMVYDGGGTRDDVSYNENCSVALAWLDLPLTPP